MICHALTMRFPLPEGIAAVYSVAACHPFRRLMHATLCSIRYFSVTLKVNVADAVFDR